MRGLEQLMRAYELRHFPAERQLDLHGEGPKAARDRALHWIQSFAHELPGEELLLVVERGKRPGAQVGPVHRAVEGLLRELEGGLLEWWQPFGQGSLALRLSKTPRMVPLPTPQPEPTGEGRTPETAGAALIDPADDVPRDLMPLVERAAELRRTREGISLGLIPILMRRVWIEAQAQSMSEGTSFRDGVEWVLRREEEAAGDYEF